jgi:hypothetical protein
MKTNKLILFTLTLITYISFISCVEDGDFTIPENLGVQENKMLHNLLDSINNNQLELKTISEIKQLYVSGEKPVQITSNLVIKGYVVSSDKEGNYFREFYMQDKEENPTAGIKVALNLNDIYNKYNIGREVYIRLKNIYIGETNSGDGVTAIGGKVKLTDSRELESIRQNQEKNHFFRSPITKTIIPKTLLLSNLDKEINIGTFVKIENAFFSGNVDGKSYIDPTEDFGTKRKIEACQGLGLVNAFVETSSFASFANNTLPKDGGAISAVVSKDFNGDFTVLVLNSTEDVYMTESRCSPASIEDFTTILLDEDFESTSGTIDITGWTNYKQEGTRSWKLYFDEDVNSTAVSISSFGSRNESTISWLITSAIDLDSTIEEYLSFETSTSFADGSELEVLISIDWNGAEEDITNAIWTNLPARIASNNSNFREFFSSTFIDLSSYSGKAYIAFKYIGSGDVDFDGTYQLDNIMINAK